MILVVLVLAGLWGYQNRQLIQDHLAASEFDASPRLEAIVDRLQLTPEGERVFYASHPTVSGREHFNQKCSRSGHDDGGHLLGCYTDSEIHLFEIDDERIAEVVEVTAAHELLHATYARLAQSERESLASQLHDLYNEFIVEAPDFEERMSVYASLSASRFANELHSIFATEVRDLPDWLEEHYSRWFLDRAVVVDMFESYHEVFTSIQQQAEELQQRMTTLRGQIDDESNEYALAVEQFNADWNSFRDRNEAYEFSNNPEEFYRLRDSFDDRQAALGDWRENVEALIDEYNDLVRELAEISEIGAELNELIDSDLTHVEELTDPQQ